MQVFHQALESDPEFRNRIARVEAYTARHALLNLTARSAGPVVIPVVVHVVYDSPELNLSDEQVRSQIDVLNEDYNQANADRINVPSVWSSVVGNAGIRFALATTDPSGASTTGIVRKQTTLTSFSAGDDGVKSSAAGGDDPWPSDRYLNVWTCNLGGGLLGYATFPLQVASRDGVVILASAFGRQGSAEYPYDRGRTMTHEVGHWLNLRHIWGDTTDCSGTDYVDDTPNAGGPNYRTPTFPHVTCGNGPNGDMFMNFMDYVDDAAMIMFTQGQCARMAAALDGPRASVARGA
jgi:hypothetical protein